VAGLIKLVSKGALPAEGVVVCTLTGHGLKDPERAIKCSIAPKVVDATLEALSQELAG
jgi:threonine synthase